MKLRFEIVLFSLLTFFLIGSQVHSQKKGGNEHVILLDSSKVSLLIDFIHSQGNQYIHKCGFDEMTFKNSEIKLKEYPRRMSAFSVEIANSEYGLDIRPQNFDAFEHHKDAEDIRKQYRNVMDSLSLVEDRLEEKGRATLLLDKDMINYEHEVKYNLWVYYYGDNCIELEIESLDEKAVCKNLNITSLLWLDSQHKMVKKSYTIKCLKGD